MPAEFGPPAIITQTLPVEGMTCASCVARVEKALRNIDGVQNAVVNLATEQATIHYDPSKLDLPMIRGHVVNAGYDIILPTAVAAKRRPSDEELKRDLAVAASLTVPLFLLSLDAMLGWERLRPPFPPPVVNLVSFVLSGAVLVWPGKRFFRGFVNALIHRTADMNSLVAIGSGAAFALSAAYTLFPRFLGAQQPGHVYFDTAAMIVTLILLGKFLEAKARRRASEAMKQLLHLQPKTAHVLRNGMAVDVPLSSLVHDDIVEVRPGERIPVDGCIVSGRTAIDESIVTGESIPVEKRSNDNVIAGTINTNGSIQFRATAVGEETVLAQIVHLVERAQAGKPPVQALADKVASVFVPAVVAIATLTFLAWLLLGGVPLPTALMHFVAVLVIACPCALGLATPTAMMVGSGVAATKGILIRNVEALEKLKNVDTLILDKTGTLTTGIPAVRVINAANGMDVHQLLLFAASVESRSEHPIGRAIVREAETQGIVLSEVEEFTASVGGGVSGTVQGRKIVVGTHAFLSSESVPVEAEALKCVEVGDEEATAVGVGIDGQFAGAVAIADSLKESSPKAVAALHAMGIDVAMLTGDNERVARAIAQSAGITDVIAGILPAGKSSAVRQRQAGGHVVAMVGDGVNDAPALAQADVGIAMGSGTDVAAEAADITLMRSDLQGVVEAVQVSSKTFRIIKQNLFWAFVYNVAGIPLAAFGLLNPTLAATAMALSSVSVVSNSLRLSRMGR